MATAITTPTVNDGGRRKSGRTTRAPAIFSQEQHRASVIDSAKRKRLADGAGDDDEEMSSAGDVETESEDEDEGEPDEEEIREKNRKRRPKQSVKKPAAKRLKTTAGASTTLAIRSANAPKKTATKAAKQKARSRPSQVQATGLYADVFGKGLDAEAAANSWHNQLVGDNVEGVRVIVNFILQVVGSDARVESQDIDDADNIPNRLGDIITEYTAQSHEDYPLSGKQRQYHGMKEVFSEFFKALPHALHSSGLMYESAPIWENLHTWIGTMSGAAYRSFRHTATTASLAMTTGLTEVGQEIRAGMAVTKQQLDAEKKKKNPNKGRLKTLEEEMASEQKRLEHIDAQITEAFDTVFVHRYRDVDERLRVECAAALGSWIFNYKNMFLEGQYLRYLGWVLSDTHSGTRLEVLRQLKKIYGVKSNLAALRGFSERFRARIVEMGVRDADLSVRVEAIEVLNQLRSADYLLPEDIDSVGQLVFDNEPRIRKAVANFFVSNIQDLYAASIEDFDAQEFNDILPDVDRIGDFDEPCKLWINFKCLAQTLGAQTKEGRSSSGQVLSSGVDHIDSRYMVATRAIFNSMPELTEWESLAGYLLHDHSSIPPADDNSDLPLRIQNAYKLVNGEDMVLLDVLYCAAQLDLSEKPEQGKKLNKALKEELQRKQETATHNLSVFIPQLHNKYGSDPQAVKSILRLHLLYDPDLVDDVEEGQGDTAVLLENLHKQFTTQNDTELLSEASRALRAALAHETSREAAEKAVDELWHEMISNTVSPLLHGQNIAARGTLDRAKTRSLTEVMGRLLHLAGVKDCCDTVEGKMPRTGKRSKAQHDQSLMDVLLDLVRRGEPDDDTPQESAQLEDQTCKYAIQILSLYYRWKVVAIANAIVTNNHSALSTSSLTNLAVHKNELIEALMTVASTRKPLDSVRTTALLSLMDLHVLFATLRHKKPRKGELDEDIQVNLDSLVIEFNAPTTAAIMETHEKMEGRLGRITNKKNIELPLRKAQKDSRNARGDSSNPPAVNGHGADDGDVDRPPEDSDDEGGGNRDEESDDEASTDDGDDIITQPDEGGSGKEAKKKAAVVAEKALCEFTAKIVLAVFSGVLPKSNETKARLQVNRTKLGKSYTQVIAYLDEKKEKGKAKSKSTPAPVTPAKKAVNGKAKKAQPDPEPMELSDDEIEDDERDEDDPERLREQGLEDDPIEEENDEDQPAGDEGQEDDDDIMGD